MDTDETASPPVTEQSEMATVCRHCGAPYPGDNPPEDWLCAECGRYQDQGICPTCHQITRLSTLAADVVAQALPVTTRSRRANKPRE